VRRWGPNPLPEAPEDFVHDTYVLPVEDSETGVRIDLIFSTIPYEAQAIERAISIEIAGETVPFATAEDLVLHKLFAARARDLPSRLRRLREKGGI